MNKKVIYIISVVLVIGIFSVIIWIVNKKASGKETDLLLRIEKLEKKLKTDSALLQEAQFKRDSLYMVSEYLGKYRALVDATYFRDSVRYHLKYTIGDIVLLKRDSAKVVITDIIAGGSKYEYYLKYKVQHRDKTIEEVFPDWIF